MCAQGSSTQLIDALYQMRHSSLLLEEEEDEEEDEDGADATLALLLLPLLAILLLPVLPLLPTVDGGGSSARRGPSSWCPAAAAALV